MEKYAEVTFQSVFKQFILGVGVQGSPTEWVSSSHRFCKPLKVFFYALAWQTEQFSTWRRASEWKDLACCRRYEGSLLNFSCVYFQLSQHRMFCQPRSIKRLWNTNTVELDHWRRNWLNIEKCWLQQQIILLPANSNLSCNILLKASYCNELRIQ